MKSYQQICQEWKTPDSDASFFAVFRNYNILFAYNSAKIENQQITYHDTREVFENGRVSNFSGDPRTLFEIRNQKFCTAFLQDKILNREPVSVDLIRSIHAVLMSGCYDERRYIGLGERPGAFRTHDFTVGRANVGLEARDIEPELTYLCSEVSSLTASGPLPKESVLKCAAWFHLNFEYIHPFADGNGRVGRTLLNYILVVNDHPPAIIFDEHKEQYYHALECFDLTEEIDPFADFLKQEIEQTWNRDVRLHYRNRE